MSAIWFHNKQQEQEALESFKHEQKSLQDEVIYTVIKPLKSWTNAEFYHQKYLLQCKEEFMKYFKDLKEEDFINSTETTKVFGYLCSAVDYDFVKNELPSLKLDENFKEMILKDVQHKEKKSGKCKMLF